MKPNRLWRAVMSRLASYRTAMSRLAPYRPDPDDNVVAAAPQPDTIDHICDFLAYRFDQHLDRWQVIVALALAAIILSSSLFGLVRARIASSVTVKASAPTAGKTTRGYVYVYICGAVHRPGVYRTPAGSRVNAAVSQAGGLAGNADATRINLARKVVDGERIYVLRAGETAPPALLDSASGSGDASASPDCPASGDMAASAPGGGGEAGSDTAGPDSSGPSRGAAWRSDGRLNLNMATAVDLDTLPGIGPAYAARILDYRQKHNGFTDIDQLGDIRGIGPKTFAKLKPLVCIE